ncbi:MAG TPA: tRNA uridine-5-carboxymethylaminomethyl(34) synthesis GTPase MnmE [Syntrophorhabdales bacterium]|nr:tRNA uridine-5-carboxymethylaminomethyl(34) synthesis GTPase MnmE [Syntrophorhabdales bacterium]
MKTDGQDTIAAVSSPLGGGGIGIIRMSGPQAHAILKKVFRPRKNRRVYSSHRLYLGFLFDPLSMTDVDEVFAVFMDAPRTYTKEKMAEVYCHGGLASQREILLIMMRNGARMADPGEFTRRAFLNGRIDLAQAESVLDIIESEGADELKSALAIAKGELSARIGNLSAGIAGLTAEVEASIDFPDEGLDLAPGEWLDRIRSIREALSTLIASFYEGRAIKQGLEVLIVGRTNVGKSSLLNALSFQDRAIVTPMPGTTRDLIEETIHVKGVKFRLVDTAGLRSPGDAIEEEGIGRVKRRIPEADIILWVLDASEEYTPEDEGVFEAIRDRRGLAVLNKTDLAGRIGDGVMGAKGFDVVRVSAKEGSGLEDLKDNLYRLFAEGGAGGQGVLVTNVRHRDALARTEKALQRAQGSMEAGEPIEFAAYEVREALQSLGEITGETCTEDLLDQIFSRFCIGK